LIGDAAHPMVPHLGQGAGQAIEDAYTLGILLKGVPVSGLTDTLARYEQLRRERTSRIQGVARQAGAFYRTDFSDPASRDAAMGAWAKEVRWILEHDADAALMFGTNA
jgi:salicylate hydroxylase